MHLPSHVWFPDYSKIYFSQVYFFKSSPRNFRVNLRVLVDNQLKLLRTNLNTNHTIKEYKIHSAEQSISHAIQEFWQGSLTLSFVLYFSSFSSFTYFLGSRWNFILSKMSRFSLWKSPLHGFAFSNWTHHEYGLIIKYRWLQWTSSENSTGEIQNTV